MSVPSEYVADLKVREREALIAAAATPLHTDRNQWALARSAAMPREETMTADPVETLATEGTVEGKGGGAAPRARHETFTVEFHLAAPPGAVFAAFADTPVRRRWFKLPGRQVSYHHDFTVHGGETSSSVFTVPGAAPERLAYASRYLDITPGSRIVHTYTARVDEVPRWASLVTVELHPHVDGTRLRWTEQAAFLVPSAEPEHDVPHLRGATRLRLNGLATAVTAEGRNDAPAHLRS
ncbi:SRPBCC domain-containing protein [Streptomyces lydicus]|uniref:SRPBCC domain-containing protein n=1 Tax=Streptomyces lydicus TaxID=47763 RepID=UPI0037A9940A